MHVALSGTRAFITGCGAEIGRARVIALARQDCSVAVAVAGRTRRTRRILNETVASMRRAGGAAGALLCDVRDENSVSDAVRKATGDDRRLDFTVNSAGVSGGDDLQPLADYSPNGSAA